MALTTTLRMTRAHLHPVSNPSQGVICGTSGSIGGGGTRSDDIQTSGEFRSYANGVTRLVTGSTVTRSLPFTLRALSPAQVAKVYAMVGKTCLFRDTYGRKVYGSFLVTSLTDIPLSGDKDGTMVSDVAITFQQVNYTEAV
jgi:hypothetical protein